MTALKITASAKLPTLLGEFEVFALQHAAFNEPVLVLKKAWGDHLPIVRIHSSCATGDIFSSLRCDCQAQLHAAQKLIGEQGGLFIYAPQEGRGIGIVNKIRAYALQDAGVDTIEANLQLGFAPDLRDFAFAGDILKHFNIAELTLLTNNPQKCEALQKAGWVVHRQALWTTENVYNQQYLQVKQQAMGHFPPEAPPHKKGPS